MQRLGRLLQSASSAAPIRTSFATGASVMCVGDAAAQLTVGRQELDLKRNLASSAYNGMASPVFFQWYRVMDWLIPGIGASRLIPKTLLSQIVTTGGNNPCYLAWCNHLEAWLNATSDEVIDWAGIRQRTLEQCRETLPKLYGSSMLFWIPVTACSYAVVPGARAAAAAPARHPTTTLELPSSN